MGRTLSEEIPERERGSDSLVCDIRRDLVRDISPLRCEWLSKRRLGALCFVKAGIHLIGFGRSSDRIGVDPVDNRRVVSL